MQIEETQKIKYSSSQIYTIYKQYAFIIDFHPLYH